MQNIERLSGTIQRYTPEKQIGTIQSGKNWYFFHANQITYGLLEDLRVGLPVTFIPNKNAPKPGRLRGCTMVEIVEPLGDLLSEAVSK
jgi:hypothetical protein